MEREIKEIVNENVANLLDKAARLETGSEEQKRAYDSAREMLQSLNDDYRNQQEYYYRAIQLNQEKEKNEGELNVKKFQAEEEAKAKKRISPNTAANLIVSAAGVVFTVVYEAKGHMIGKMLSKYIPLPSKSKD